jgi:hypothetical protein
MTQPDDRIDPSYRFHFSGQFDEFAYEEDLLDFPNSFDENGWPLFGEYDPYILCHPITQEPWHLKPRMPTKEENDNNETYVDWFHLAEDFQRLQAELLIRSRELFLGKAKRQTHVQFVYLPHFREAIDANRDYLLNELLPPLDVAFAERSWTPKFTALWGEFCRMAGEMDLIFDREEKRQNQRRAQAKYEQQQWYAHYFLRERPHHKNARKTEQAIAWLINAIVDGDIPVTERFEVNWFENMLDLAGDNSTNANYGELAEIFTQKRFSRAKMKNLQRRPTKDLPPLDLIIPRP